VEVRAILSVAKGLSWVEFVVLGCEVEVLVAVWGWVGFWCGGFAQYLAWLRILGRARRGILMRRYAETPSAVADAVPDA